MSVNWCVRESLSILDVDLAAFAVVVWHQVLASNAEIPLYNVYFICLSLNYRANETKQG